MYGLLTTVRLQVLIADAVMCQALVHVLTESYLEFMKASRPQIA